MLNPKLKTLNSKQTQMAKAENSKFDLIAKKSNLPLSYIFWICLGCRV
jgi:hypothetical protein